MSNSQSSTVPQKCGSRAKMRIFLSSSSLPPSAHHPNPKTPKTTPVAAKPNQLPTASVMMIDCPPHKKTPSLIGAALTGALSFTFLFSSPTPSIATAFDSPLLPPLPPPSSSSYCREDERPPETAPSLVTNQEIVEEAWQIVNDGFLDTGSHRWSPQSWLQKKEDIIGTSLQTRTKAHDVIKRMLASLGDPYTRFLSPAEFSKMARYDMTGIGVNLREIPDDNGEIKLKVLGLILDGPAHTAGVRQGDELLSVNGVDVRGKSAFEASTLLQGPSETLVNIMVKHGNCGPIQSIEVQRQLVAKTPVFYRLEQIENGATSVGYVRLKEFNALARKDLITAMKRLQDMGASFFVLDLRDNLGGLVQEGIEISKLFLNEGETVTYTIGREPRYIKNIVAESIPLVTTPVIVLVNKNTASASEIVATALHDNCRAILVGERTFGKGLIQSVFELHDGSGVVVTIGKYVTPNHMDINGNGIEPDFKKIPALSEAIDHLSKCQKPKGDANTAA